MGEQVSSHAALIEIARKISVGEQISDEAALDAITVIIRAALNGSDIAKSVKEETEPGNLAQFKVDYDVNSEPELDAAFSIYGPNDAFFGECGLGFDSDGNLEFWLFDKDDTQTVTVFYCVGEEKRLAAEMKGHGDKAIDLLKEADIGVLVRKKIKAAIQFENLSYYGEGLEPQERKIEKFTATITVNKKS